VEWHNTAFVVKSETAFTHEWAIWPSLCSAPRHFKTVNNARAHSKVTSAQNYLSDMRLQRELKVSQCTTWAEVQLHSTSALGGGEWSAYRLGRFTPTYADPRRLGWSESRISQFGEAKYPLPLLGIKPRFLSRPARSLEGLLDSYTVVTDWSWRMICTWSTQVLAVITIASQFVRQSSQDSVSNLQDYTVSYSRRPHCTVDNSICGVYDLSIFGLGTYEGIQNIPEWRCKNHKPHH
jgi:hypothetical protein